MIVGWAEGVYMEFLMSDGWEGGGEAYDVMSFFCWVCVSEEWEGLG